MMICMPCSACRVIELVGQCLYPGERRNRNRCRTMHITIFASIIAKFWPTQFRGPAENGKNAIGCWHAFKTPLAKRWGLKSWASGPQSVGSTCKGRMGIVKMVPAGIIKLPSFKLLGASLRSRTTGGYNRSVSFNIIPTCSHYISIQMHSLAMKNICIHVCTCTHHKVASIENNSDSAPCWRLTIFSWFKASAFG